MRVERPRESGRGDLASNAALALAGRLGRPPRAVAAEIARRLDGVAGVERVEVAGPGFLNFHLRGDARGDALAAILRADARYGRSERGGGRRVMVEFVSANPTGPLHLGHGRQAALGDAIANLLEWTGWKVHREFYFNDAGAQVVRLAESVRARYRRLLGLDAAVPAGGYLGDYVNDVARALLDAVGDRYGTDDGDAALDEIREFAVGVLRAGQERDLARFGVRFDECYPETRLYEEGRVERTVAALSDAGFTYERDGATWLATSRFGDQKDRVMVKRDGSHTYFVPDVAYHMGKWERGYRRVVNVQGADHHGTVDRVRAGLGALGRPAGYPEYVLHQMVTVVQGGEEARFSKRAGSYTTLAELTTRVGGEHAAAVVRYFFLMRRAEAHLTFDLDLALDESDKNPVYKAMYAHARLCRLLERGRAEAGPGRGAGAAVGDWSPLVAPLELELARQLVEFPEVVRRAARTRAPHLVCDYAEKTAGLVNSWYQSGHPTRSPELRALTADAAARAARLGLADAARIVLRNALAALGIDAPRALAREA